MASLNSITRPTSSKRPSRRVGRGNGSKRGKTSGRGTKGQSARSGNKKRPEMRDIIKKLPKRRGYGKNRSRTFVFRLKTVPVALESITKAFDSGTEVTVTALFEKGVIKKSLNGRAIKIVSDGGIDKKLSFKGVAFSARARAAVEKAGGSIA